MIGPLDWALIESWQNREIPLKVVLRAIDEVFDSFEQRGKDNSTIKSLKYCSDAVESRFVEWQRAQTGKSRNAENRLATPTPDLGAHIDAAIMRIDELLGQVPAVLKPMLEEATAELSRLGATPQSDRLEDDLDRVDAALDRAIIANKVELLMGKLRKTVEKTASEFGINPEEEGPEFDRIFSKAVRTEYKIPNLGIYRL